MLVYDIEIKNPIADRRNARHEGIEYAEGWTDYVGMGVACIGVYDCVRHRSRVFLEDNLDDFRQLVDAHDLVVGFNNVRFDDRVLEAHGIIIPRHKSYDLLREIYRGLNVLQKLDTDGFSDCHKGYSLEAVCYANFGLKKNGNGADAPIKWQRNLRGEVIDYCLADVALTKRLLDRVNDWGWIYSPKNDKERIPMRRPAPEVFEYASPKANVSAS
jgi:hypothetical protein